MKYKMRLILFFVGVILLTVEGTWSNYAYAHLNESPEFYVLRVLFVYIIFITMFADRTLGLVFAGIFGLLIDVSSVGFIGIYTIAFPLLILGINLLLKILHENIFIAIGLSWVGVAVLEIVIYQYYLLLGYTAVDPATFIQDRLLPTMILNLIVILICAAPFYFLCKSTRQEIKG